MEAVFLGSLFALLPRRRWTPSLAGAVAACLVLLSVLGFGDAAMRLSLGRPLNLTLDAYLLRSVHHLLSGATGPVLASVALAGAGLFALALTLGLARLLASLSPREGAPGLRYAAGGAIVFVGVAIGGEKLPFVGHRIALPGVQVAVEQTRSVAWVLTERSRFQEEFADTPDRYAAHPGLLQKLRDTDVLLSFIESYGISAVEDERYAPVIRPRLIELEERVRARGLHLATGTLTAPVQGGQSWLARGTVLSGLWLDNQIRYDLLLAAGRETLIHDFRHAGHGTVGVMPAITMAWPEGERLGYDEIFAQRDMGYRGPPLNWVTMPDQYTWSFLETSVRDGRERPLFTVTALISSHAPWTPILPVLEEWEAIGDGAVFSRWEDAGETPAELWRDADRVREHYALSVDYALGAMTGYAERYVDDRTLLIVMGDHQPAPLITGEGASRAVPVHVITGERSLLEPFLEWGFREGGLPEVGAPAPRMDAFRHWFVHAFSHTPSAERGSSR